MGISEHIQKPKANGTQLNAISGNVPFVGLSSMIDAPTPWTPTVDRPRTPSEPPGVQAVSRRPQTHRSRHKPFLRLSPLSAMIRLSAPVPNRPFLRCSHCCGLPFCAPGLPGEDPAALPMILGTAVFLRRGRPEALRSAPLPKLGIIVFLRSARIRARRGFLRHPAFFDFPSFWKLSSVRGHFIIR